MEQYFKFKTALELFRTYDTEDKCRELLVQMRWNGTPTCERCGNCSKIYTYKDNRRYKCYDCNRMFTAISGTIFQCTKVKLDYWFYAMYFIINHKRGISSCQLSRDLKIPQNTAWFMLQRIRHAMKEKSFKLTGEVELDETYVGGKEGNKHKNKRTKGNQGRSMKTKSGVYGMVERGKGGRVKLFHIKNVKEIGLQGLAKHFIDRDSIIHTDEFKSYRGIDRYFEEHCVVNHGAGQYVVDDGHTNTIECFWSHLKRGIIGVYYHTSKHLLYRYLNEFAFRWNTRLQDEQGRMTSALNQVFGRRLTWEQATDHSRKW